MNAATWVLVGVILGLSVGFVAGCILGIIAGGRGPCAECQQWQALVDELEAELVTMEAQATKAAQTIADLNHNIGVVWDAGVMAGQTFQADRQENDL
jgi:uncharacterized protein YgfB (UPF0149 family)